MQRRGTRSCDGYVTGFERGILPLLAGRIKRLKVLKTYTKQSVGQLPPIVTVQSRGVSLRHSAVNRVAL